MTTYKTVYKKSSNSLDRDSADSVLEYEGELTAKWKQMSPNIDDAKIGKFAEKFRRKK